MRCRFFQLNLDFRRLRSPKDRNARPLLALALASMILGCSHEMEDVSDEGSIATISQRVVGGTLSEREAVVLVRSRGPRGNNSCSGTLVAPNLVLTARHCVSAFTNGDYSCTIDGFVDLSRPRSPANAGDMGLPYPPENVGIHVGTVPDFDSAATVGRAIFAPETDTICRNDIAFVLLEDELDFDFSTLRLEEGVAQNEPTTVVGFGINDNRRIERTERSDVLIDAIGFSEFYPVEGNALPRTFVLGRSVCPGDSGGPAFSDETDEVLGVFSFFRGDCESAEARNFFTQVAPFRSVALQAFEEAGYLELVEPEEEPPPMEEPPPPEVGGSPPLDEESGKEPGKKGGCAYQPHTHDGFGSSLFLFLFLALTYRRRRICGADATNFTRDL